MTVKHFVNERGHPSKILAMAALLLAAINTEAMQYKELFEFDDMINGYWPNKVVVSGNTLYGTTEMGGPNINANPAADGTGTIFKINTDGTGFAKLYNFSSDTNGFSSANSDGADPWAGLVLSSSTLYGTAHEGGDNGKGTIFKINTDGTGFTTLHSFSALQGGGSDGYTWNYDGAWPVGKLVLSGNILYGRLVEAAIGEMERYSK